MAEVMTDITMLEVISCGGCGIRFGVPQKWLHQKRAEKAEFKCPNGCNRVFIGKTDLEKAQEQIDALRHRVEIEERAWRDQVQRRQRTERQLSAQKGQMTKLKKRIHDGVCPCCKRTFTNLARHMESQHPDFTEAD